MTKVSGPYEDQTLLVQDPVSSLFVGYSGHFTTGYLPFRDRTLEPVQGGVWVEVEEEIFYHSPLPYRLSTPRD